MSCFFSCCWHWLSYFFSCCWHWLSCFFSCCWHWLSCLFSCCWHWCTVVDSSTLGADNRCEHFWSSCCFSVIMYVARCLLSWLLFADAADFWCIFRSRDYLLLLLTTCMMSLLFICTFVCIIFSLVKFQLVRV